MKKGLLSFLVTGILSASVLVSHGQSAKIQVIHNAADPALDTIDVYTNGILVLDNFVFRSATPFIDVPPAITINVGVAPANSSSVNDTVKNFEFIFGIGQTYCVMAIGVLNPGSFATNPSGLSTAFNVLVTTGVKLVSTVSGNTELYCSHGVTDAASTDFLNRNVVLMADNLDYGNSSAYSTFPSLNYVFDILDSAQTSIDTTVAADFTGLVDSAIAVFSSGFLDPAANQNGPGFGVFAAYANGQVIELPPVKIAYLQAIHNCSDPAADSLDIWALGFKAVDNFMYRTATNYLAVPAGIPLDVGVALGNSSVIGDTIRNFPVILENGKNYIALASGVLNTANFAVNPDGLNISFNLVIADYGRVLASDPGEVDFITVHGTTDASTIDLKENAGPVLVDNLSFSEISSYVSTLPSSYNYDVTDSNNTGILASFEADMTPWAGKGIVVFTSGFLDPAANQNGSSFGLFAALPDGSVIPFPDVTGVSANTGNESAVTVSPNPASDYALIQFNGQKSNDAFIRVFNSIGQELYLYQKTQGNNSFLLNTSGWNKGFYWIEIQDGSNRSTLKLVVY